MKILMFALLFAMTANSLAANSAAQWAQVTEPSVAKTAQSIGTYNGGCLAGAAMLATDGEGYQVMRLSRKRFYGHSNLIGFIEQLGKQAVAQNIGTLLIGDLGQPRGGPTLSGHRSHQSGLDVDIWFLLSKQAATRSLTSSERESWGAPSVLVSGSDNIDYQQWSVAHETMLQTAAELPEVDRIFVNASVKRELCNHKAKGSAAWLRKIRPWWKHDDHFHVRLKCPADSKDCDGQEPLPQGDGCDASLAWWFSDEAKHPTKKTAPAPAPELPALCTSVLNQ